MCDILDYERACKVAGRGLADAGRKGVAIMLRRIVLTVTLLAVVAGFPQAAFSQRRGAKEAAFSSKAVDDAIEKARDYLWKKHRKGGGSPWPAPGGNEGKHRGGRTALALYALLSSGDKYNADSNGRLERAVTWLSKVKTDSTYVLGVRMQVWSKLPPEKHRPLLKKDMKVLIDNILAPKHTGNRIVPGRKYQYGTYTYHCNGHPERRRNIDADNDHSNTHIGLLGAMAAAQKNIEIPRGYWQLVYDHWKLSQNEEGGWRYAVGPGRARNSTGVSEDTMVAAGLASVFVAYDNLSSRKGARCGRRSGDPVIEKALGWMDKYFMAPGNYRRGPRMYYYYAIERVGLASGYKHFGRKDWYKLGATDLIDTQRADGSWHGDQYDGGDLGATAFALIFLARGRNPVVFNRLKYEGDWNNRPRALAYFTRWASNIYEGELNWQIVDVRTDPQGWHDAQTLLISGAKPPKFDDQAIAKLRTFVNQGGALLSVAECGGKGKLFAKAMREVYAKLFPKYELTQLNKDHEIYSTPAKIRKTTKLWAISNGVRIVALHTTYDLLRPWQDRQITSSASAFKLGWNIHFYLNEKSRGRPRGSDPWPIARRDGGAKRVVRVARVKYGGNWNPEPGAWERVKIEMGNRWGTDVKVEDIQAGALDAKAHPLAVITGTGSLSFSADEKKTLRAYVQAGGTLLIDAAGGRKEFAGSAISAVEEIFGRRKLSRIGAGADVYNLPGMQIRTVKMRKSKEKVQPRIRAIEVNGRPAVLLSKDDLTVGLVGCPAYGCKGYSPTSAMELTRNIVLYAAGVRPAKTSAK